MTLLHYNLSRLKKEKNMGREGAKSSKDSIPATALAYSSR
uniref:Uncharacterized protein n=1 Tax=Utricularia reniformis TaxID=192314 RepID=A0A1Y0B425_9LAMI|nr:hypothetical protein AEK19_MT2049 [Utricularia reniformis]ART32206.1 hypothetical protein AEK19_MT2049 [Utricularia reniformis]